MPSEADEASATAVSSSAPASAKKYAFTNAPPTATTKSLWGPLAKGSDLKWSMTGAAWITEAQNFYIIGNDGSLVFMQIGYSNLGWPSTTCQVTARYYRPPRNGGECVNLFETQTLSALRMKMSSDYTSVTVSQSSIHHFHVGSEELAIVKLAFGEGASVGFELNLKPLVDPFEFKPDGTIWFASSGDTTSEFIRMRFVPAGHVTGQVKASGHCIPFEGHALLIHQFQGIKPHIAAKRWNLAYFASESQQQATTLFQLQLMAADAYHGERINYGAIVRGGQMYAVSTNNEIVESEHFTCADSAFEVPRAIKYTWRGTDVNNAVFSATCSTQLCQQCACISLLDSVPYVLRKVVEAFVAKPYVYQWLDRAEVTIKTQGKPDEVVSGWIFQEICMI